MKIHPKYKINPTELTKQIQVIYNYTAQFINGMLKTMFKMAFFYNSCINTKSGILLFSKIMLIICFNY